MHGDADFSRIVRSVIHRDRIGHRLLVAYYVLAGIVVVVSCSVQPADAGIFIGAGFGIGVILLADVSIANNRALRPLRTYWPDLATLSRAQRKARAPAQPHSGAGGVFFVVALLLLAAVGGIAMVVANASAASATTQVTIQSCNDAGRGQEEQCTAQWEAGGRTYQGTVNWASEPGTQQGRYNPKQPDVIYSGSTPYLNGFTVMAGVLVIIVGPLCAFLYITYQRAARRPYLETLEYAASEADRGVVPPPAQPDPAGLSGSATIKTHRHYRPGELIWGGILGVLLLARIATLPLVLTEAALGSGTGGHGTVVTPSPTPSPYPTPALARGVVIDVTAGISYAAPPGTGWSEDTDPGYPAEGAEFTKPLPGQSDDEAFIVSAPLPADIAFTGANALQDAAASYVGNLSGTLYSAHTDTVLANHSLSVCGRQAWLAEFRVHYTTAHYPDETAALVVVSLGGKQRPGTLFATIPDVMGPGLATQLTQSVRLAHGC